MSRTTKTILFIVVCYLIVGTMEQNDYESLDYNPHVIEYQAEPDPADDYDGPGEDQLIRS